MDEFIKLFSVFAGMGMAGALIYGTVGLIGVGIKRLERGSTDQSAVMGELDELRRGQDRVAELEARLDFAERLLVQQRDGELVEKRGQLGSGGGGS